MYYICNIFLSLRKVVYMKVIKKVPLLLWLLTLFTVCSFLLIMSSLIPIYYPAEGVFGVAILLTENYKLQLFCAAICFITSCAWICSVGIFIAEYRHDLL